MPRHNHPQRHGQAERPGSTGTLVRATRTNRRNQPCPCCGRRNQLTPADVRRGKQCGRCEAQLEGQVVTSPPREQPEITAGITTAGGEH